jgi:hypothetical protein
MKKYLLLLCFLGSVQLLEAQTLTQKTVEKMIVGTWKADLETAKVELIKGLKANGTYKQGASEKAVESFLIGVADLRLEFQADGTLVQTQSNGSEKLTWQIKDAKTLTVKYADGYQEDKEILNLTKDKLVFGPAEQALYLLREK